MSVVSRLDGSRSAGALRAGSESFGQELAQHVGAGAFLGGGEGVDLGERVGVESDGDLSAGGSVRHVGERIPLHTCHALGYSLDMTTDGTRDANGISYGALNWRGNLADLTDDQLKERADAMAWWIANDAAENDGRSKRAANDPVVEFRNARDAWLARVHG